MPNQIHNAANYSFTEKDRICFDTNIWFYLLPSPAQKRDTCADAYTKTIHCIIRSNATIIVDISILSEYLNRYARMEWDAYEKDTATQEHFRRFKDFRNSDYFKPIAEGAARSASKIIARCKQMIIQPAVGDKFEIEHILEDYGAAKCDFADAVLAETCRIHQYKIFTNDDDFGRIDYGIEVITHNSNLLTP